MKKKFRRMTRSNQFKIVILTLAVAFVIWLIARLVPYKEEGFSVKITVNCDRVQSIMCVYYLNGDIIDWQIVDNVNRKTPMPYGEVVSIDLPSSAFDNPRALRTGKFEFTLDAFETEGHPVPCTGNSFFARFGEEYSYVLTYENGKYFCAPD